jgi:hypothetical protein
VGTNHFAGSDDLRTILAGLPLQASHAMTPILDALATSTPTNSTPPAEGADHLVYGGPGVSKSLARTSPAVGTDHPSPSVSGAPTSPTCASPVGGAARMPAGPSAPSFSTPLAREAEPSTTAMTTAPLVGAGSSSTAALPGAMAKAMAIAPIENAHTMRTHGTMGLRIHPRLNLQASALSPLLKTYRGALADPSW